MLNPGNATLEAAINYMRRAWSVIPIPHRQKYPSEEDWPNWSITTANVHQYFNGAPQNIGVLLGQKSNGLTDIDIDCAEALRLMGYFLPQTAGVFGRKSKPRSHHLYIVKDAPAKTVIQHKDENGRMLVELRLGTDKAAQTVFPPSEHESGEAIEWHYDGAPALQTFADLRNVVRGLAVASMLLRHWPKAGWHDFALRVGGFLGRAGQKPDEIETLVEIVAREAGSRGAKKHAKTAKESALAATKGERTYGLPALRKL